MRITEAQRTKKALEIIENIAAYGQCSNFNSRGVASESYVSFGEIFQMAHTIHAPKCRKNHPAWTKKIDDAIRLERKK